MPTPRPMPTKVSDLLDRERLAAFFGRVVVGEQAGAARLGDRLAEAERAADRQQRREVRHGRGGRGDARPRHHGVADGARADEPVGQVAGGHADQSVDEHERRQQQTDLQVGQIAGPSAGRGHAAQDVLVDLVDHDHEAEHPHGPLRDCGASAVVVTAHVVVRQDCSRMNRSVAIVVVFAVAGAYRTVTAAAPPGGADAADAVPGARAARSRRLRSSRRALAGRVFTSTTCDGCARVDEKARVLEAPDVAYQEISYQADRACTSATAWRRCRWW